MGSAAPSREPERREYAGPLACRPRSPLSERLRLEPIEQTQPETPHVRQEEQTMGRRTLPAALAALVFAAGCAAPPPRPKPVFVSAEALWSSLQTQDYQKSWRMWPGKAAFYPGTKPHGALLTTYINDPAENAIHYKSGSMPWGAIVVTENYTPDKVLTDVTVMYKVNGYNPMQDDWFWAKYGPRGEVLYDGKVSSCIDCHSTMAQNDYLWSEGVRPSPAAGAGSN
jgi:hypothetical protein